MFPRQLSRAIPFRRFAFPSYSYRFINRNMSVDTRYLADAEPTLHILEVRDAFEALTKEEKLYAYHLYKASWAGGRIIMDQTTAHAQNLVQFILTVFSAAEDATLADLSLLKTQAALSDDEWTAILSYAAQVLANLSNFRSFGATKFVPRADAAAFERLIDASPRAAAARELWASIEKDVFALTPEASLSIGKPEAGHVSAYYPGELAPTDEDVAAVQALADASGISTLNTRLSKLDDGKFKLLVASSGALPAAWPKTLSSDTVHVEIAPGDFATALANVNTHLERAASATTDANRRKMLEAYVRSFTTGDIEAHKDGSRHWVRDTAPAVESYIGFIENYVDPFGARAEWEGFVAVVNRDQSRKFATLVEAAPALITGLPWGPAFEVPVFQRPDFTSLDVLSFATAGLPAGINIPNYHDVREADGFKNVSLANVLSASGGGVLTFIAPEETEEHEVWQRRAFGVQVANHELLGHGTGRLFQERADGTFTFDRATINPLTGAPVASWYAPGETYGARIGPVAASMEECRAEAVALYLAGNTEILAIFGYTTPEDTEALVYHTFLGMARAGIRALEFYDPTTRRHGQAHMEARLGITNWLVENGLVSIEKVYEDGKLTDAFVRADRARVLSEGKAVMGRLLLEIQVRKSTGDGPGATAFYKKLTTPADDWVSELRPLVLAKKQPRPIFVQPNLIQRGDDVTLIEYPATLEGCLQSYIERGV